MKREKVGICMKKIKMTFLLFILFLVSGCGYDDVYKEYKAELDSLDCSYVATQYEDTDPYPSKNYKMQFSADENGFYISLNGQREALYDNDGLHDISFGDYMLKADEKTLESFLKNYKENGCPAQVFAGVNLNDISSASLMESCSAGDGQMGMCFLYKEVSAQQNQIIKSQEYTKYSDIMNRNINFSFGYDLEKDKAYFYLDNVQHSFEDKSLFLHVQAQDKYISIDEEDYNEIFKINGNKVTFPSNDDLFLATNAAETSTVVYITTDTDKFLIVDEGKDKPTEEKPGNNKPVENEKDEETEIPIDPDGEVTPASVCASPSYRKVMKVGGIILNLVRILVPIAIIIFGAIDLYKAITSSDDKRINKAAKSIIVRVIAGVAIFLLPGIVQFALNMVNEWSDYKNSWCCCTDCLLNPDCDVNSCNSDSCKIEGMN